MGDDGGGDVDAARALDPLEPGRAVDLEDLRPLARFEHVDPGHFEPHHPGRCDGGSPVGLLEGHGDAPAAPVQIRPELSRLRLPAHRGHHAAADHDRAQVPSGRFGDVLLKDDVLPHRPERFEQRRDGLGRLRDHRSDPLRALLELDDAGRAPHLRERLIDGLGGPRVDRHGHVDVLLRQELHGTQLVARSRDRERRVDDGYAHQVELAHHGQAVVRDRCADARQDDVRVRGGMGTEVERRAAARNDHAEVERIDDRHLVPASTGRQHEPTRRIEGRVSREKQQPHCGCGSLVRRVHRSEGKFPRCRRSRGATLHSGPCIRARVSSVTSSHRARRGGQPRSRRNRSDVHDARAELEGENDGEAKDSEPEVQLLRHGAARLSLSTSTYRARSGSMDCAKKSRVRPMTPASYFSQGVATLTRYLVQPPLRPCGAPLRLTWSNDLHTGGARPLPPAPQP